MTTIEISTLVLSLVLLSGCGYHLFSLFCVREFFSKRRKDDNRFAPVAVSILKPIKGTDPGLRENVNTFCRQEYPEYEVLLGLSKPSHSEVEQIRKEILPSLERRARLVTSDRDLGPNRKVSNLQGLAEAARHPLLAISDSDMRVEPSYLRNIVGEFSSERNVGLVTSLYKISDPQSAGAALESLTIALDFLPSVLVARRLEGITFGLGASMLISKKGLEDIGGFPAIADYLADDYQLGNRLAKKGYTIVLSRVVLENIVDSMSIKDHLAHQIRWARTYRASRPKGFAGYGITHIFPAAVLLCVLQSASAPALAALGFVLLVRFSVAAVVYKKVISTKHWLRWLPLLPVKDLISFGIWCWSFGGRTVSWRGRSYRILKSGKIVEAD